MEILNCKGMTCPQPVIETKNYLLTHPRLSEITVLVDNPAAAQNVERFLGTQGLQAAIQGTEPEILVTGFRQANGFTTESVKGNQEPQPRTLIMITRDTLGQGDDQLGSLLMVNFLRTLNEMGKTLWRMVFVNAGVKLTIVGAEPLAVLQELEAEGVSILVCGTCLNHFGLLEKKKCGETTNMLDIVTSLQVADKVITF
ncbi:MAG: sulfurtransferase-like selenium metabolism protein YedF [Thermodesulfobacteriota bacterium]